MWKKIRSWVAALMVAIMLFNSVPIASIMVFAADADVDYLFLATDRHTNTSIIGTMINNMEAQIGEDELDYLGLGGDMVGSGSSHPTYNSATVLAEVTGATSSLSAANVDIVAGIHDMNVNDDVGIVLPYQGGGAQIYEGNKFYVYGVPESCISGAESDVDPETEANDFVTWANGSDIDKSKVIIVLSHYPLHKRRNDNVGASYWVDALNKVAVGDDTVIDRDIAFFWGHNHTNESSDDTVVYHVTPNNSISVQETTESESSIETIYFTYANAGYLNSHSSATLVTIKDTTITFDKYKNSSVSTTNTVTRVASTPETEEVVLEGISVTGTTEYNIGDELALTVTANYSDGSAKDVTTEVNLTGADMSKAGTYTVKATYEGKKAEIEITVVENTGSGEDGKTEDDDITDSDTPPAPETAPGSGTTTTTTKKTVYVLTSSISSGNDYLIVNGNSAGSYYALANNNGSVAATSVTVKTDSEIGTYIELDDAADELWTVSNSYRFQNGNYYLGYTTSGNDWNPTYTFGLSTTARTWSYSYSNNRLSTSVGNWNSTTYYLQYSSRWTWTSSSSASGRSVYFYVPTEIEVETTTPVSGTYSIAGTPDTVSKVVVNGTTTTLGSTLTFTPESGTATTTDVSSTATYTIYDNDGDATNGYSGDPNNIIDGIDGNTVTFTGNYGEALVKVSYKTDFGTVTNYITVEATAPTYHIEITKGGTVVNDVVTQKGVVNGTTLQLGYKATYEDGITDEPTEDTPEAGSIEWSIPPEYANIASINQNGLITFKGVDGNFDVFVSYETPTGERVSNHITISATTTSYTVPSDNTNDFPEYPNEGAIRYDKTAEAVGNFSETGIVKMELSMTGVPYTTGSEIDVVVMLDMTGSMSDNGMEAAELATIAFVEKIVKNQDGSYNENRIAVYAFNSGSSSPYELVSLKKITSDTELATATTAIKTASDKQTSGGTPFDEAAAKCHDVLEAAKTDGTGNDRQQFCVFMSDGGPTSYAADDGDGTYTTVTNSGSGTTAITTYLSGYSSSTSSSWSFTLPSEYYTNLMKDNGVTVYTVGLLLQNKPNNPSPYSSMTSSTYDSTTDSLTSIGSHYYFTSRILKQMASDESKYIDIFNVDNASKATAAFESIALQILQAATDVTVEDKITDEYTMIFDIPEGTKDITGVTNDFYIEFVKYTLDEEHERTDAGTSITKLYLKKSNGVYSAASDSAGTAYAAPVFENKTIGDKGTLYYWTTEASHASDSGVSYKTGNTTYYFVPYGIKATDDEYSSATWFNMTSGGYASGTVDSTTNMSDDLIIATPYFVYNAGTKMIYWTVDKLDTTEYALNYFLYLDDSATEVGTNKEVAADTYPTNDHAYITYTNFNGKDCRQEFPIPQMTWNGAQVSYVFYLVNAAGQPINKSGQVVDFANAVFVTEKYTKAVVWNKNADGTIDGKSNLSQTWLAKELLPEDYVVYDESAGYDLYVYASHTGENLFDYFTIKGGNATEISSSLNSRLGLETKADTVSVETTKVYNTKAGTKYSVHGTYTSDETDKFENETVLNNNFDFANTTVAFAVVWQPKLVPDTIVVDYGLDVLINVVQNDLLQNIISGIGLGNTAYGDIAMNTGVATESQLGTAALKTEGGSTISIENENTIRYSQNDMSFDDIDTFYYESPVEFYEESDAKQGYMYSSVTVIPATTVYYEDSFVTFNNSTAATGTYGVWTTDGTAMNATQAQDRPGKSQISETLDADNNYGYDTAYDNCTTFSMGSAKKVLVNAATGAKGANPTATFTFHGTGFDLISVTDNTSGMLKVTVKDSTGATVKTMSVNNYYGYTKDAEGNWIVVESEDENALYQVPVIQITELPQATYTVTVDVMYMSSMDKTGNSEYNIWIDAVRVYDPASTSNGIVSGAYEADGELNPGYIELRDLLLAATDLDASNDVEKEGVVFIDGVPEADIADYEAAGPNNEVYLEVGQAVAFKMVANDKPDGIQLGAKLADGSSAELYLNGALFETLNSATDRNYILDNGDKKEDINHITWTLNETTGLYESNLIVLSNKTENSIISLTNLKAVNAVFVVANSAETASVMSLEEDSYSEISVVSTFAMARAAVDMLNASDDIIVDEPTVEEPEEEIIFKPEKVEISWSSKVKEGKKATLIVITSDDVEAISVDGIMITEYKTKKEKGTKELRREWTYTITAPEAGEYDYEVIVYDAEDNASEPIIATLKVQAHSNGKNKGGR